MAEPDAHERNGGGRHVILAARLEWWIETELRGDRRSAPSRRPGHPVRCLGPHPRTEARVAKAREALGAAPDAAGCGRLVVLWAAYRCVECGRWFHRACIARHFEVHRTHY